ncbi:type III secretion system chaperone [Pseudothauera rhizosphaerae]|uniref:Type III secretion system chaperone n=1 Tax=Pseudothauera rhizosphaerae TaxID=2565932 RepID=A0A4S4AES1_9RHOO|nr:type III secretion system chaperone [Pseudothauera rhizosphaerae]THF57286.1 type III secretion system chaperone [Pseudothauera rhizosphaerae]
MHPRHLTEELGRHLGVPLALDDAGLARLIVDGQLTLDFELDAGQDRLLAYAVIGTPPGGGREALFAELLAANLFGAETGRASPALDSTRGELLLWLAFDDGTDVQDALAALGDLVTQATYWRSRLAGNGATSPASSALPPELAAVLRA